jgi:PleD family two-component response regulator
MGVATLDMDSTDPQALIKRADERLYEAKSSGRNCVCA